MSHSFEDIQCSADTNPRCGGRLAQQAYDSRLNVESFYLERVSYVELCCCGTSKVICEPYLMGASFSIVTARLHFLACPAPMLD